MHASDGGAPAYVATLTRVWPDAEVRLLPERKSLLKAIGSKHPDLIIFDSARCTLTLEEARGILRQKQVQAPILILAPAGKEDQALEAVLAGADDYVIEGNEHRLKIAVENLFKRRDAEKEMERVLSRLRSSEQGFRYLIENVLDVITVTDINASIVYESPSVERVLGYKPEELVGRNAFSLIHPIDIATTMPVFMLAAATPGVPHSARFRFKHKDGSWHQLEAVGKTIRDPEEGIRLIVTSRDITERERTEAALGQSEMRFRSVVEGLSEGLVITDSNSIVTYFNSRISEMTGYMPQEIVGQELFKHLLAEPHENGHDPAGALKLQNTRQEAKIKRKDGSFFWAEMLSTPFRDGDIVAGTISAIVDITDRKNFELGLDRERVEALRARDHAEEMNRLKSNFLANLSHEIRTPLTSIIGFAGLLKEALNTSAFEPSELALYASTIQSGGERLLGTMSGLLDLASFEAHHAELRLEPILLCPLISAIAEEMRPFAENKLLRYEVVPSHEISVRAALDAHYFRQALRHVIGNAIKFTHTGRVRIGCHPENGMAVIEVSDTGVGISEAFLPHVYDAFEQESVGSDRHYEGNGLGLTLAKQMVERMDGKISAESIKGTGSTFRIAVPISTALPSSESSAANPETVRNAHGDAEANAGT